ncbi:MAG: hypothetical protein ACK48V_09015, partial [Crocinitomicaceae bacterium]
MIYFIVFILIVIGGVILAQAQYKKNTAIANSNKERFNLTLKEKNLPSDQILFTEADFGKNCLSINEKNRKVSFGKIIASEFKFEDYDFSDIVAFEVQVDDKKTGSLSVGGAVVGGILAGGVGAIIGGTTGKGKTKVKTMNLLITVNSISNPLIKFPILRPSVD